MPTPDQRLAAYCAEHRLDGVIIRRRSNAAWVTGGGDFHCVASSALAVCTLLWMPAKKIVFTDSIEGPRLRDEEPLSGWEVRESPWWKRDEMVRHFTEGGRYASDHPDDRIAELRWSLNPDELERARALGRDAADAVARVLRDEVRRSMTEHHAAGLLAARLREREIKAPVLLVAADDRIVKYRHPIPTNRPLERLLMAVVCAERRGLIVAFTRLVSFGPVPDDLRRRHQAACAVDRALHAATRPGARWCDALRAGIRAYEAAGFGDEWRKHHQGGPMGYECRDFVATPTEERRIAENQLVGWNPSITGTKSEDTIVSGSAEVITPSPEWPMLDGRPDILVRA